MFSLHWFSQQRQRNQPPQKSRYWLRWGRCYDVMVLEIYPSVSFTYRILKVLGRTLRDFLSNLDNLHEYLRFSYQKIKPPSFFVTNETPNGLTLHYRSKRKGFVNFVMGQVSALYSSQIRDHDRITQSILVTHPSIQSVDLYKRGPEMPLRCWMFKLLLMQAWLRTQTNTVMPLETKPSRNQSILALLVNELNFWIMLFFTSSQFANLNQAWGRVKDIHSHWPFKLSIFINGDNEIYRKIGKSFYHPYISSFAKAENEFRICVC